MPKTTTAANILSTLANKYSARTDEIANAVGVSRATAIRTLRKLDARGFVFCEDDYDGRQRRGGKYANALWVMNCETSGFDRIAAARAIARPGHGGDILCDMNLGV